MADESGEHSQERRPSRGGIMRWVPLVVGLAAVSLWAFATSQPRSPNPESVMVGRPAPAFELAAINRSDETISLASLAEDEKPILVNFWASWCTVCIDEAPDLQRFYETYGDRMHVLGIAIQDRGEEAMRFARRHGMEYPLVIDPAGATGIDFGMLGVPETFVIGADGTIRRRIIGVVDYERLVSEAEQVLNEPGDGGA